jgi:outer membrane protein assembly factor BamB
LSRLLPWLTVAVLLFTAVGRAEEGEWSRFRGPNGTGISSATTVPATWTEKDYNWKVKLPGVGHSSPVVWGQRIFVTCGNAETAERTVLCLDAADGRPLWRHDYPSATYAQHPDSGYASATPVVDGGGVIVTWTTPAEVTLLALSLDGRQVWRRNLGPFIAVQGSGSSPIICGDLVVLANDQENPSLIPGHKKNPPEPIGKSSLIAVDRRTGRTRWTIDRPTAFSSLSTPCIYRRPDGRTWLIFTSTLHGITLVDPATGKIDWELDQKFVDRCVSSPLVAGDLVFAGYGAGLRATRYVALRLTSPTHPGAPAVAYEIPRAVPLVPTPVASNGRLFCWTDDGIVSCLGLANGELIWRQRVGGAYYSSPICVNNRLYCIAKNGEVVVLAAADKFQVLARVPLGEPSFATAAVAGGVMYLRTRSHLFSLGGAGKADSPTARRGRGG